MSQTKQNNKKNDKYKKELAKVYGLNLNDIEHVELDNGKELFKFYDPKDNNLKIVENRDYTNNINSNFKNIQQELSFTQSEHAKENAKNIYNHKLKYNNIELELVPILELKANKYTYIKRINSLSTVDRKKVGILLNNVDKLGLIYINIENAFGIDNHQKIIDIHYDYQRNNAIVKSARVLNTEDKKELVDNDNVIINISDADIDLILKELIISDQEVTVADTKELLIQNEKINTNVIVDCYNMPEAIDKMNLTTQQKGIYRAIVNIIKGQMSRQKDKRKNKSKKLLKRKDRKKAA